jgi:hypothetical protein
MWLICNPIEIVNVILQNNTDPSAALSTFLFETAVCILWGRLTLAGEINTFGTIQSAPQIPDF